MLGDTAPASAEVTALRRTPVRAGFADDFRKAAVGRTDRLARQRERQVVLFGSDDGYAVALRTKAVDADGPVGVAQVPQGWILVS